jgi:hypothetical protein
VIKIFIGVRLHVYRVPQDTSYSGKVKASLGTAQVAQAAQVSWVSRGRLAPELMWPGLLTNLRRKTERLEFNYYESQTPILYSLVPF